MGYLLTLIIMLSLLNTSGLSAAETDKGETRIYFPHNRHLGVMKKKGDPCMRCHPFSPTTIKDPKVFEALNAISNKPLKEICHSCHAVKLEAVWECRLCHKDPRTVWPDTHQFDYKNNHREDARAIVTDCRECHIKTSFCTNCHFRRDGAEKKVHTLGYRSSHGLGARLSPGECGMCHSSGFCNDCHRRLR